LIFFMGVLSACGNRSEAGVVIAGSTSVQPLTEILAEEYEFLYSDRVVDVQGGGSSAGTQAAASGTANIGMSSRELRGDELDLWSVQIALDGLAIIVHPDNPVTNLSLAQVRDIYSAEITDWSELGGNNARIHIVAREEGSGTRGAFEELVMGEANVTPRAIVQNSNGSIRQLVSGDPNAIGFISLGLVGIDDRVKALYLDGVSPSWENIMDDSYALFRAFLFVVAEYPVGATRDFIDFALSETGQQVLANEGLIPLHGGLN